jgi:hypothetical protein
MASPETWVSFVRRFAALKTKALKKMLNGTLKIMIRFKKKIDDMKNHCLQCFAALFSPIPLPSCYLVLR